MTALRELAAEAASCLVVSTIHPSAVLRSPDDGARERAYQGLVADLSAAGRAAGPGGG